MARLRLRCCRLSTRKGPNAWQATTRGDSAVSERDDAAESVGQAYDEVIAALDDRSGGVDPLARVCQACVELLGVDGAAISATSGTAHREVQSASDEVIAGIEALQFTLGEGPSFEAFASRGPVLVPDLAAATTVWPVFATEIIGRPVGAIFAFPLHSGAIRIGGLILYRLQPGWMSAGEVATALQLVDLATLALLASRGDAFGGVWAALPQDREQVHQATGMLLAAYGISAEQALARLRAYAFATGRLVDEVARDLVTRKLAPTDLES